MPRKFKTWVERDEYGELPELSEEQMKKLREKAFNYCIYFLNNSDKTRKQLEDKMKRKNCPEEIIEETLAELERRKYINDYEFAMSFAKYKKDATRGDSYIRMQLQQRGVEQSVINEVLSDLQDPDEDFENALEFGRRQWRSLVRYDERERRQKLTAKISRRGYGFDVASRVFDQLMEEEAEDED